jgi:hypothetical protein
MAENFFSSFTDPERVNQLGNVHIEINLAWHSCSQSELLKPHVFYQSLIIFRYFLKKSHTD